MPSTPSLRPLFLFHSGTEHCDEAIGGMPPWGHFANKIPRVTDLCGDKGLWLLLLFSFLSIRCYWGESVSLTQGASGSGSGGPSSMIGGGPTEPATCIHRPLPNPLFVLAGG